MGEDCCCPRGVERIGFVRSGHALDTRWPFVVMVLVVAVGGFAHVRSLIGGLPRVPNGAGVDAR